VRKLLLLLLLLISVTSAQEKVHVRQYTRKDGTVVSAHDRSAPKSRTAAIPKASAAHRPTATAPATKRSATTSAPKASAVHPPGVTALATKRPATAAATVHRPAAVAPVQHTTQGQIVRSASARRQFEASRPCPATGRTTGACPGYVVDHIKPLACGGADSPSNMQWQTVTAAKEKDRWERTGCAAK